jgi:hypothetical protein
LIFIRIIFLGIALELLPSAVFAGQGCCSSHGGEAGCAGARVMCSDGIESPTCRCDHAGKHFHVKDKTVNTDHLNQKTSGAINVIGDVWAGHNLSEPVVTSANDGKHSGSKKPGTNCTTEAECRATSDSYHYKDRAIDVRSHDMDSATKNRVVSELKKKLGQHYRVAIHDEGKKNEHIHIEYHGD